MTETMLQARVRLLLRYPFFATLLLNHACVEEENIKTADIDGKTLRYNPNFFNKLDQEEQVGLLAHEVMHPALCHHTRRGTRDPKKWNIACDYALNWILKENGIKLPTGALVSQAYQGKTSEQIYEMLPDNDDGGGQGQDQWQSGDGFDGGLGDVRDLPSGQDKASEEITQQGNLIKASQAAKGQGSLTGELKRIIDEILYPKVDLETALDRLLSEKAKNDYSWKRPNRNYIQRGIYAPSMESIEYGECVITVDTSMSITQEILNKFSGIINKIADIIQNKVTVLYVDSKLKHVDVFEAGDEILLNLHGGGGTDFKPAFEYLAQEGIEPKLHIYLTDGECDSFPDTVDHDLVWICTDRNYLTNPPVGETIYFDL